MGGLWRHAWSDCCRPEARNARLPATDFLPVRVELRQVAAESDLQEQIEFAVRKATGGKLSWPRLVESGGGVLPVVMLDGFDELLQATGVAQTDFLVRVMASRNEKLTRDGLLRSLSPVAPPSPTAPASRRARWQSG
jgi:hypothetical protein